MKKFVYALLMFVFPVVTFAQSTVSFGSLNTPLSQIKGLVSSTIPILIGIGIVVFLYGVIKYVLAEGDPSKRSEARGFMIWGIVGLFVMVSVWGLVGLLQSTFGVGSGGPSAPTLPQ